jgi:hypothetical protein
VVIFDTAAAIFAAPNENDNHLVTKLLKRTKAALQRHNCAELIMMHTPKMSKADAAAQPGEATLARGGGSWVNTSRIALSITAPAGAEAPILLMQGLDPNTVRRIDPIRITGLPPGHPTYFRLTSVKVPVDDGGDDDVRAIEFIATPNVTAAGIPDHTKNVVLQAVIRGVADKYGNHLPLTLSKRGGGSRSAIPVVANELLRAYPTMPDAAAQTLADKTLHELIRIGVVTEETGVPKYKGLGKLNGAAEKAQRLDAHPDLAPWTTTAHDKPDARQTTAPATHPQIANDGG